MATEMERNASQAWELWFEIRRYAYASERLEFRKVVDEMSQSKALSNLQNTASLIRQNTGFVATRNCKEIAQQFRAWAARLRERK